MIDVTQYDDLDAVAADAAGALDRAAQPSLHDRLDWLRLHAAHGLIPGRLRIVRARGGGGAAWLFLAGAGRGRATACASWYTLAFAPVHYGAVAMRAPLLTAIARWSRGRVGRIVLAPLREDACDALRDAFVGAGWHAVAEPSSANWVAHVGDADFAAYWARRPSRLRNTARRKARGLDVALFDRFDDDAWAAYETVYARSWKPNEGSPAFVRALARQEGGAGCLRLGIASAGGRPIAAQMWTVEHGIATIHKLAYVEAERARSPGTVLGEAMFAHVIGRDRPRLIDFGTGDDPYKADWMDERRPLHRITLSDPTSLVGAAGIARHMLGRLRRAR